eukprot:CCRYP_000546-RA/>CCRYP_000546-RA protein AED:0.02 eAED:0.02 QI:154/1/1/1/1/1/2/255/362
MGMIHHSLLVTLAFALIPTSKSHRRKPTRHVHSRRNPNAQIVSYSCEPGRSSAWRSTLTSLRGGAVANSPPAVVNDDEDDQEEERKKAQEGFAKLVKYRSEQQLLYQVRATYLSEMLAARGVPLPTVVGVATVDGSRPPEKVDWDCALSTLEDPKSCLYSFDAEPNTKVVAPVGTDQWISLSALNRLRRTDPTKVEPMWHSRYAILQSWFSDASEYSILQHIGIKGFVISSVLLDGGNGMVLRLVLISLLMSVLVLFMPLLEYIVGRILVSAPFWSQWQTWGRIIRAGFPLKLLLGQLAWKGFVSSFSKMEGKVRDYFVDLECDILEESVPLTVGSEVENEEEALMDNFDNDETDEDDDDEY